MSKQFVILLAISMFWMLPAQANVAPLIDLGAEAKKADAKHKKSEQKHSVAVKHAAKTPVAKKPKVIVKEIAPKEMHGEVHPLHWSYFGKDAPRYWGELSPEYATCKTGKNQSPINLKDKAAVGTTSLAGFDVYYRETALKIIDNGHTLQVNLPLGSYIKIKGHRYELLQYHFHTPSEHQKDGFNYPMEMHLVHKDGDGNLAVIAIIFQEGETNPVLAELMNFLPKKENKLMIYENVKIHPAKFFPSDKKFYKYSGSLTTPPCTEGVYWMVFKQPVEASVRQLEEMNKYLGSNARPVQKIYSRSLLKSWPDQQQSNPFYEFY